MTVVNYASSIVNKLKALLTDDARVVIYDRHVLIVQATSGKVVKRFTLSLTEAKKARAFILGEPFHLSMIVVGIARSLH
jgi:hypothetical protein